MAAKSKLLEDRVARLEQEVAVLGSSGVTTSGGAARPGFAEEGQTALSRDDDAAGDSQPIDRTGTLEARIARLETEVAALRNAALANPANTWLLNEIGRFAGDAGFDEAMRLGRDYRRRLPKC